MHYEKLREQMVRDQFIARGITDQRVLAAFYKVEREKFVPCEVRDNAYQDFPLSIGEGQTISQPYMVALMTQSLELKGDEKILEIGTGSGYQTAILAELARKVYSVERMRALAERARKLLEKLGYSNVKILLGDGTLGWEESSPYDRILVTAGARDIPRPLTDQLEEGGVMVIPVGNSYSQDLEVVRKRKNRIKTATVEKCVFVPLIGKYGWDERRLDE
ncbi:Protein-L-isoaspartate O-methyltransferase [subsurface metagenome]